MTSTFKLVIKVLPYAGIAFSGLMVLSGLANFVSPGPSEPARLSISDLREGTELPRWIEVRDGVLNWTEAVIYHKSGSGLEVNEAVAVPYVHPASLRGESGAPTACLVVKWDWSELRTRFPEMARILGKDESARDRHRDAVVQASLTPFTLKGVPSTVAVGRDADMVASLEQEGYSLCTFVSDGSAPATRGQAAFLLLFFAATGYGCFRWIKHRRAGSMTDHAMKAYRDGLASGMEKAIRESLESGMARARAETPPALPTSTPPAAP